MLVNKRLHRLTLPARCVVEREEDTITGWVEHTGPEIEKRGPKAGVGLL